MPAVLTGLENVAARLSAALDNLPGLTRQGVQDVALDIAARAAEKAPKDTGTLRASVETSIEEESGDVIAEIAFREKYAAYQHEHVELYHTDGEAKYLERAALEKQRQIAAKVSEALENLFGGDG